MTDRLVLIIGAGPTGLVLALWLTRLGVRVRIIDKTAEPGTTSRAVAVPSPLAAATSRATARSTSSSSSPVNTLTREPPAAGATAPLASRTGMPPAFHE